MTSTPSNTPAFRKSDLAPEDFFCRAADEAELSRDAKPLTERSSDDRGAGIGSRTDDRARSRGW